MSRSCGRHRPIKALSENSKQYASLEVMHKLRVRTQRPKTSVLDPTPMTQTFGAQKRTSFVVRFLHHSDELFWVRLRRPFAFGPNPITPQLISSKAVAQRIPPAYTYAASTGVSRFDVHRYRPPLLTHYILPQKRDGHRSNNPRKRIERDDEPYILPWRPQSRRKARCCGGGLLVQGVDACYLPCWRSRTIETESG